LKLAKSLLALVLLAALAAGCGSKAGNEASRGANTELETIQNGVVLYYDSSSQSQSLLGALTELSKSEKFDLVTIDVAKDKSKLDKYEKDNQKLIAGYQEVRSLEAGLSKLKLAGNANSKDQLNNVMLNYRKALNLVKNGKLNADQEKELDGLVKDMAGKQELSEADLKKLLELQKDARLKVPVYSALDGDAAPEKLPVMKVIYEGNHRTSFYFGQKPIPAETLANADNLRFYLKEKAWISNFQVSSDGPAIEKKLENKETFILLVWGNSCPHCHKVMPVLDKLSSQTGVKVERIDTFNESNNKAYAKMAASGKYGLTQIKWVPTLVFIKDGQQQSTIGVYDWAVENATADMGYDIDDSKIKAFMEKAK
jgi:thiol-disulfide isomerase/thioredoxin